MNRDPRNLGQLVATTSSIPEYIQVIIAGGAIVSFLILWLLEVAPPSVLLVGALGGAMLRYFLAFRIPVLRTSLRVYEHGLEWVVQGKSVSVAYDKLEAIAAQFTDKQVNGQYIGTLVTLRFYVDGRLSPYVYECDFFRGHRSERVVNLAVARCSEVLQRRLLAQLERDGLLCWRDNVALSAEGLLLADSRGTLRLTPYGQIECWKMVDNQLQIWKTADRLPFLVLASDTPNFMPLFELFQSLCQASRDIEPAPVG
jgi:hypothetical protein